MYDPKKEIIIVREKIRNWVSSLENILSVIEFNKILDKIILHIDNKFFLDKDMLYYKEALEGWQLIRHRNQLEKDYPRIFKKVINEEKREIRETFKMMKEDSL
jgi:hypothetical protein